MGVRLGSGHQGNPKTASWPPTPRRPASPNETSDSELLHVTVKGKQIVIGIPKQKGRKGGMGVVMKGFAQLDREVKSFAVKICRDAEVMNREYTIWGSLHHKNILELTGILDQNGPFHSRTLIFVSHFMKQGSLANYLKLNALADRLRLVSEARVPCADGCPTSIT
ncbi:hypothetical protein AURDEDRAFT_161462 [Auricularia subglabra TFB-10046 SS5]|nr:hypothetical protein AURDEDRAFT_161462 [Auricularia subglabra TFB-10046 SS5]